MAQSKSSTTAKRKFLANFKKLKPSLEMYGFIAVIIASVLLLLWRLSSLTAGLVNLSELSTKHALLIHSPWWQSLNTLYGPYYLLLHAVYAIHHSVYFFRLASVIVGLVVVSLVYWIVSSWHGYKIGLLAAAIILTNFGLLASAREATYRITQLLLVIAILYAVSLLNTKPTSLRLVIYLLLSYTALYVPGGIWISTAALLLSYKNIINVLRELNLYKRLLVLIAPIIPILPLAYQLIRHFAMAQFKAWLGFGLNGNLSHMSHDYFLNLIKFPADIFFSNQTLGYDLSLGHLPLMPITFSLLFILGLYYYITKWNNWHWRSVLILLLTGWIIGGLGILSPLALLPLIAITTGTGLAYMLKEWFSVFPRNPIARYTGIIVMFAVISLTSIYAIRTYIVGWANNPNSSALYSYHLK